MKQCGNTDDFLANVKNVDVLDPNNLIIKFVKEKWELFHFIVVMSYDMRSFLELLMKCDSEDDIYAKLSKTLYALKCGQYVRTNEAGAILKDLKLLELPKMNKKPRRRLYRPSL